MAEQRRVFAEKQRVNAELREAAEAWWQRALTAPSLQDLVAAAGGYPRITPEGWAQFDADVAAWESIDTKRRRIRKARLLRRQARSKTEARIGPWKPGVQHYLRLSDGFAPPPETMVLSFAVRFRETVPKPA